MGGAVGGREPQRVARRRAGTLSHPFGDRLPRLVPEVGPRCAHGQVAEPVQQAAQPQVVRGDAQHLLGESPQDVVAGDQVGRARRVPLGRQTVEQHRWQPRKPVPQARFDGTAAEERRHGGPGVPRLHALSAEPADQRVPQVVGGPVGEHDRVAVRGQVGERLAHRQRRHAATDADGNPIDLDHVWAVVARVGRQGQDA